MGDFRNRQVWVRAHELALDLFQTSRDLASEERYGLTSQIRRLSAAIPATIARGCGLGSDTAFYHCCTRAMGVASELEYNLLLARDIGLLNDLDYERLSGNLVEVKRMLAGLMKKLMAVC